MIGEDEFDRRVMRVAGSTRRAGEVLEEYFPEVYEWLDSQYAGPMEMSEDDQVLVESLLAVLFRVMFPEPGRYVMPEAEALHAEAARAIQAMDGFFKGRLDRKATTLGEIADALGGELRQRTLYEKGFGIYLRWTQETARQAGGSPNGLDVLIILRVVLGCWDRAVQ
ncbi:MAG: hypothetical protein HC901_03070, partial [Bdellovibrionaceae bacterium]|nr:hypothetical protein [Pseudobdellovibrionaceae bacterium]